MKIIIMIYAISYSIFVISGCIVGKMTDVKPSTLRGFLLKLYDPFTVWLKERLHRDFVHDIKQKRVWKIGLTIFANNLLFGCLLTRTVYGLIFFYPYLLMGIGAFTQGMVISRIKMSINPVLWLEFLAYLLSASIGTKIGIQVLMTILSSTHTDWIGLSRHVLYFYAMIGGILGIHACTEAIIITRVDLPANFTYDREKSREELLQLIDTRPGKG